MAVVILASVTAMVAAAFGAYRIAQSQTRMRQQAYAQLIANEIENRVTTTVQAARLLRELVVVAGIPDRKDIATLAGRASGEAIDQLVVLDADGIVVASYPITLPARSFVGHPAVEAARTGATSVTSVLTGPDEIPRLWASLRTVGHGGTEYVVLAAVERVSLHGNLDEVASAEDARTAIVADSRGEVLETGSGGPAAHSLEFAPEPGGGGVVSGLGSADTLISGAYVDIREPYGLKWRVAVLEPNSVVLMTALGAAGPVGIALLAGGLIALVFAWLAASQVTRPLRALEKAARVAASGAYVKTIDVGAVDDEVGRLAGAFNAVALRLNALRDLSDLLAGSSKLDQVLDGIISAMTHIVGPCTVSIYLSDSTSYRLSPVRCQGACSTASSVTVDGDSWVAEAYRAEEPITHSGSPDILERFVPGLQIEDDATVLAAPLRAQREPLGVIVVVRAEQRDFSAGETQMVKTFSSQAAVAVENSRLFELESESRRTAEALRAIAEQLARPMGLSQSLTNIRGTLTSLLRAKDIIVSLAGRSMVGLPPAVDKATDSLLLSIGRWVSLTEGDEPAILLAGASIEADELINKLGAEELLVVPFRVGTEREAVLCAASAPGRAFSAREVQLAAAVGRELELAFDNAFFFRQAQSRAHNLETIFQISQAVGSELQIKTVLGEVLDVVQKIFSADAVSLLTIDESSRMLVTAMARGRLLTTEFIHFETAQGGNDLLARVFTSGEPIVIDELEGATSGVARMAAERGLHSMLSVPLAVRESRMGVLTAFSVERRAFGAEDMSLLQTFASQAALAIHNASMYSKEHRVATILKASILPEKLPEYPELETAAVYVPLGALGNIGGDYYDTIRTASGIVVLMGDVCGKGVQAATKTSMLKHTVRGLATAGMGPAEALGQVNRMVAEGGEAMDIVTLWMGVIDPVARTITWADGGHPPGFLRRAATGEIVPLGTTGPLLGAMVGVRYEEETVSIEPGDMLLLYTDGVTEARREGKFFGEERVVETLREGGTSEEVATRLAAELERFVGGRTRDDVAIVAARFIATAS